MKEENIDDLLYSFDIRCKDIYKVIRKKFELNSKYKALKITGGTDYVKKLKAFKKKSKEANTVFKELDELYKTNVKYGSKFIKFLQLDQSDFSSLLIRLKNQKIDEHPLCSRYPYILNTEELEDVTLNKAYLAEVTDNDDEIILTYCRVVDFTERQPIPLEEVENIENLKKYSELYGVINHKQEFIDFIYINKKKRTVEFRIDYFHGASDTAVRRYYNDFIFEILTKLRLPSNFFKLKTLNIFPTLKKVYKTKDSGGLGDGLLVELCFSTKQHSNIQIRKRKLKIDIREEVYHKAGEDALHGLIDIYRLGMTWTNDEYNFGYELLIPGHSGVLIGKSISEAIIRNTIFSDEFHKLRNKIYSSLK